MSLQLPPRPISYLITSGATSTSSNPGTEDFQSIIALVRAATLARISLIQLREKNLPARSLFELTSLCSSITRGTDTRLLVNDRADIARAARADGVHLTTRSIETQIIRRTFGTDFLIGVSTHTLAEAQAAHDGGADFAVFGPVFDTPSKRAVGAPVRIEGLREAVQALNSFPLLALGGITLDNAADTLRAGACGVAGIGLFSKPETLKATVRAISALRNL